MNLQLDPLRPVTRLIRSALCSMPSQDSVRRSGRRSRTQMEQARQQRVVKRTSSDPVSLKFTWPATYRVMLLTCEYMSSAALITFELDHRHAAPVPSARTRSPHPHWNSRGIPAAKFRVL